MSGHIAYYASLAVAIEYAEDWRARCIVDGNSSELADKVLSALHGLERVITPDEGPHVIYVEYEKRRSQNGCVQIDSVQVRGIPVLQSLEDKRHPVTGERRE